MDRLALAHSDRQRWSVLARINTLSGLSQIVQIGTVTPLLSLSLERQGVASTAIGGVVSASWIAILLLHTLVPRLLARSGLLSANLLGAALSIAALFGMSQSRDLRSLFAFNFLLGAGLILRWIACDTWIVAVAPRSSRGRAIGVHETLMGLGIAVGPLLLLVSGVDSALPYYACAALVCLSAGITLTLGKYDARPLTPVEKHRSQLFGVIPIALCGAFVAGFAETSSISFLASYSLSAGYLLAAATVLVSVFGVGGTVLQLPIGWLADKSSYTSSQLLCGTILCLGAWLIPLSQPLPWLMSGLVFLWGGAIGGMNTLAVIEAGARVEERQVSTAMAAIAMAYTLGSVLGPIVTGTLVARLGAPGLMVSAGLAGALFVALLSVRQARAGG
ncbi:MFS transporter [Plasticicumulans acidivorans]|uniref:Cyanate permease n=1 Tax=Plasticicumulans acidivorans TaxID=886464 RepID=A0A317MWR1_9GAMM|nr:MFS transporter [Plasticicumulans acidivorans]PWV63180.1 cyanate permease [Plasticicumulans acidivorans]